MKPSFKKLSLKVIIPSVFWTSLKPFQIASYLDNLGLGSTIYIDWNASKIKWLPLDLNESNSQWPKPLFFEARAFIRVTKRSTPFATLFLIQ